MSKITLVGMALVLLASQAAGATELTGTPEELKAFLQSQVRTIVLRDDAEEIGSNDIAKITLVIRTKERDLSRSLDANNRKREAIATQLLELGLEQDDIKSSKYSASPQYGWFGSKPSSYEVVNTLVASVDRPTLFQGVAAIADNDDDVSFGGVEFEHSEKELFEKKVRDKAVDKILEQASYFEDKLGLKLTAVSFSYGDVFQRAQPRMQMIEEIVVTGARSDSAPAKALQVPDFDEVTYRTNVAVTFEVASAGG